MPGDDAIVGYDIDRGQPRRIMTIGEYLRRRGIVYAHRDGEMEAPTVPGRYWFKGKIDNRQFEYITAVTRWPGNEWMAWDDAEFVQDYVEIKRFVGQWWGPVVAPWEQGA